MTWDVVLYYFGYIVAIVLCKGLGKLFFVPMVFNLAFNLALQSGLLYGWDIRLTMVGYGFLFFLWVAALAGAFDRATVVLLLLADLFAAYTGVWPQLAKVGDGEQFWISTSTNVVQVWLLSILVVSLSVIVKSSLLSKIRRGYVELLAIPKRRFLIPIAMWSATILLPDYLGALVPAYVQANKFIIAGNLLVWGWVAFELPFYIMYKRLNADHQ